MGVGDLSGACNDTCRTRPQTVPAGEQSLEVDLNSAGGTLDTLYIIHHPRPASFYAAFNVRLASATPGLATGRETA